MPNEDHVAEEVRHQFRVMERRIPEQGPDPDLAAKILVLQSGSAEAVGDRQVRAWVEDQRHGPRLAGLIADALDRACQVHSVMDPHLQRTGPVEYVLSW